MIFLVGFVVHVLVAAVQQGKRSDDPSTYKLLLACLLLSLIESHTISLARSHSLTGRCFKSINTAVCLNPNL